jgi:predicted acylesterase/phospholipase RssA
LTAPPQTQELYRVLAQAGEWRHGTIFVATLLAAGCAIFITGQVLITKEGATNGDTPEHFLLRLVPGLCAAAIPLSAGVGILRAAAVMGIGRSPNSPFSRNPAVLEIVAASRELEVQSSRLRVSGALLVLLGATVFVLVTRYGRKVDHGWVQNLADRWGMITLVAAGTYVALSIVFSVWNAAAVSIGTLGVVNIFVLLLVVVLTWMRRFSQRHGISLTAIVLSAAFVFSISGWNENHDVPTRRIDPARALYDAGGPQRAFEQWYESRQDRAYFREQGKPYPVFIVAAEGGGIYAAGQEALFLARVQDQCPSFSQHIFAISSVSGGSVGAAYFNSLAKQQIQNKPWEACQFGEHPIGSLEKQTRSFIESDLLSPIIAAALFPDLAQRFLPFPIGLTDRGRALDKGMERAWRDLQNRDVNPLERPFLDHWDAGSAAPALLINTTDVDTGRRVVVAPFAVAPHREPAISQQSWFYETAGMRKALLAGQTPPPVTTDLRLSQAAGMSARFPWILPAARVKQGSHYFHLVDGGYFDNSGIETALDLIESLIAIRQTHEKPGVNDSDFEVHILSFTSADPEASSSESLNDLLAPLRALLSSRIARGGLSNTKAETARFFYCSGATPCPRPPYDIRPAATLDQQDIALALGFQFSRSSVQLIAAQVGNASDCGKVFEVQYDAGERENRILEYAHGNSCTPCMVYYWLQAQDFPNGVRYPCDAKEPSKHDPVR